MSWKNKVLLLVGCHCTFLLVNYLYYTLCIGGLSWHSLIVGFNAHTNMMCSNILEISSVLSLTVKGVIMGIIIDLPKKLIQFTNEKEKILHTSSKNGFPEQSKQ